MQFTDLSLNPRLLINLDKQGFATATQAQEQGLPVVLRGNDIMMSADTGSGKTLAFLIPCVHHLLSQKTNHFSTRCLILTPTRELAHQILSLTNRLVKGTRLQVALISGGEDYRFQAALLRKNPEIIIATPGRFMEHQRKKNTATEALEILVVDEADRMLKMGFSEDVEAIARAANTDSKQRQTLFYSATLRNEKVLGMAKHLLNKPVEITLNDVTKVQDNIQQQVVICDNLAHKQRVLIWLLANLATKKRLIFVNSRKLSETLAQFLRSHQHEAVALHGELPQNERNVITSHFRQHRNNLLVATEVAARGLDFDNIDQVINFDMARNIEDYLHRVGRTGRGGKQGQAITLVNLSEHKLLLNLEAAQGQPLPRFAIRGLGAKLHKDKFIGKSTTKKTSKKSVFTNPKSKTKSTDKARASNIWGDGTAPFGTVVPSGMVPPDTNKKDA